MENLQSLQKAIQTDSHYVKELSGAAPAIIRECFFREPNPKHFNIVMNTFGRDVLGRLGFDLQDKVIKEMEALPESAGDDRYENFERNLAYFQSQMRPRYFH